MASLNVSDQPGRTRIATPPRIQMQNAMNTNKLPLLAAVSLLLLPAVATMAQKASTTTSEADDEVLKLSPFVVSTEGDSGYYATSSLAGSRLNTNLRDVASSVQVITKEFMEDIGATNLDRLMQYTTSGETAGIQGNYVGFTVPAGDQTSMEAARSNIGNFQRLRGLGNPDKTRNFFKTLIPIDGYNTGRIDISRGANSFLFGLGSPAGLVNANLEKAVFKDSTEVSFRIGEGGADPSTRAEFDHNKVLKDKVLAFRLAGLWDDTKYRQRPTYLEDKRLYAAVTYKPFADTTVRAHFEKVKTKANPPDALLPQENLSMFLDAPGGLARASIDVVDNVRKLGNPEGSLNNIPTGDALRNLNAANQAYFLIWDGRVEDSNNAASYARVNGIRNGNPRYPTVPAYWNPSGTTRRPGVYYVKHGNYRDYQGVGYIQRGFVNLDTFDFSKYNLAGNNDYVKRDFDNFNLSLEQVLFKGKAGFEVAFDRQSYESDSWIVFHAGAENLFFDVNKTLLFPDPKGNGMTPMPNPNYGRVAVMTQSWPTVSEDDQDTYRFTGFMKHDFRDHMDGFLGKLLGRHVLTVLADRVATDSRTVSRRFASYTPAGTRDDASTSAGSVTTNYDRQLFQMIYVGPQQLDAFTDPNFTLADFKISPITTTLPRGEYSAPTQFWNVQKNTWDQTEVTGRWVPSVNQQLSSETVNSFALNTQSHLIDDLLVVNLGWRRDELKQKLRINDAPVIGDTRSVDPADWNLDSTPQDKVANDIFGYGLVLNWPRQWIKTPRWFDLSLHYNTSENFIPAAGRQDYLGNPLPFPTGESKDYGFTLYLAENKLVARVNWFEGALANTGDYWRQVGGVVANMVNAYGNLNREIIQVDANGDRKIDPGAGDLEFRTDERLAQTYAAREWLKANLDPRAMAVQQFTVYPDGTYSSAWAGSATTDVADNTTKGMEIEIIANPTPNWRVAVSVSKYKTILDNIAPRLSAFVETVHIPYLKQFGNLVYASPSRIDGQTTTEATDDTLFPFFADKAAEGTRAQEQREWSASVVTNYKFTHGRLAGFSVGGAYRWQDRNVFGNQLMEVNGIVVPDLSKPYWSDPEHNIDVWFKYGRKIFAKRINWEIQLNIRNLNNWRSNEVSVVRVQPTGEAARARYDPPREIFVTNTFRF